MLRLITGRAGSGKTAMIIREIAEAVKAGQGGRLLIVPEQYSHEAERELCAACGDRLSLCAEVLSFTGYARRLASERGGAAEKYMDKGGKLLCMALAVNNTESRLRLYGGAGKRAELQAMLLAQVEELKTACIGAQELTAAAEKCSGELREKLGDMGLILESYDAACANCGANPGDRLNLLAAQIAEAGPGSSRHIYVDGFIDFTRQEQQILLELLRTGAELTVCMTVDRLDGGNEVFELSRRECRWLMTRAKELGIETQNLELRENGGKSPAIAFFAENMFSYSGACFEGQASVELRSAESITAECEYAAARALELVRGGCRWRDIAVAVRGFDSYRTILENVFREYGVPLFTARRSELMSKPLPALIAGAYEILLGGWDADDIISYMQTGLCGFDNEECDLLGAYISLWQLRAGAWESHSDWRQHPDGYGAEKTEETEQRLERINALRRRLAEPLKSFRRRGMAAKTAAEQAAALAGLLEQLHLPEQLERRARSLQCSGREETAQEYRQLWGIIVSAVEQISAVLSDMEMDMESFGKLFSLMLSGYDVGTIPASLDKVSAGDYDRMRRRSIKHLIALGCSDDRLPLIQDSRGVFSNDERQRLLENGLQLDAGEGELWREFALIYNCLSLPSESLTMTCSTCSAEGEALRPAQVLRRAAELFDVPLRPVDMTSVRISASSPALALAGQAARGGSSAAETAAEYFREREPARYERIIRAARMDRGRLSPERVEALYGSRPRLSATRIDRFSTCKFAFFCQYGLKAKASAPAGFNPPEVGRFMHFVLENTARAAKERGGFARLSGEELQRLTDSFVEEYIHSELNDFLEKSPRFIHLFKRLCTDVHQVVKDMAEELARSDFEPLDFELDFSKEESIHSLELGDGEERLRLSGIADRVDGWLHDGKLYLRVVDYKTGTKQFSMEDLWYGMGLQMLLYLFVLEESGSKRYGYEIVPAGVMYIPARNSLVSLSHDPDGAELEAERGKKLRRSGLVLDDGELIEAWERGADKRYIPVKFKSGKADGAGLASAERIGILSRHIKESLRAMARELKQGSITADPYYRNQRENACRNCDYYGACYFTDGENGESCRYLPSLKDKEVWQLLEGGAKNGGI